MDLDSCYGLGFNFNTCTYGIDMDSWYGLDFIVYTWTHVINTESCYIHFYLNFSIGSLESQTYKRAGCCPYAEICYTDTRDMSQTVYRIGQRINDRWNLPHNIVSFHVNNLCK